MARQRKTLADYSPRGLAGLKGFWTTCNRHYGGDARRMVTVLIKRGLIAQDPCPSNGAWTNESNAGQLAPYWTPPPLHPDVEPPF